MIIIIKDVLGFERVCLLYDRINIMVIDHFLVRNEMNILTI